MPNVKIYADEAVFAGRGDELRAALTGLQQILCADLRVGVEACQIALIPVIGPLNQPAVNVELSILPRADRTPDAIRQTAEHIRILVSTAAAAHTAVRVSALDPASYLALK